MVIKVGINGFGRIGRIIFRTCLLNSDLQVRTGMLREYIPWTGIIKNQQRCPSAINDPAINAEYICYLIKFDSTHGKYNGNVTYSDEEIKIDDLSIKVFHEKLPASVPWHVAGVQYVIEASGMFTSYEKALGHLASDSVKRVIITAPSIDVPMIIMGVNDNKLNSEQKVISCASSTLYCLAPIIKVLEDNFGLSEGFITSIHAMTPSLKPLDGLCLRGKHWRDHRSIHQNIIPASTGACKALGKIIPQVKDKMSGLAFRVPIVNVSVLDLTLRLSKNTTLQDIIKNVETASKTNMRNVIKISNEQAVSSDFIGDNHSCILDLDSSLQLKPNFFKLICWYENEYSYACRAIDLIFSCEKQLHILELPCKMTFVRPKQSKKQDEVQQTDSYRKEISIECNYNIDVNSKILCSTSQDTGIKTKSHRPTPLRKPIFSHNSGITPSMSARDPKKRNEVFKIWNDSCEVAKPLTRQNRSSFFHSCIAFTPQNIDQADRFKAHERLENVKKEFSKMVNITENLLQKTYSGKYQFNTLATSGEEAKNANVSISKNTDLRNVETERYNKCQRNVPVFDVSGDCKSCVESINSEMLNISTKGEATSCIAHDKEISDCSVFEFDKTDTKTSITVEDQTDSSISYPNMHTDDSNSLPNSTNAVFLSNISSNVTDYSKEICAISKNDSEFKEQVAKTVTTLIDVLSMNFKVKCPNSTPTLYADDLAKTCNNITEQEATEIDKKTSESSLNVPSKTNDINDYKKQTGISGGLLNYNCADEKYKIHIIDEELKKRNIILVNNEKYVNTEQENKYDEIKKENFAVKTVEHPEDINVPKQILEDLNRLLPQSVLIVPDDITARCSSPENTTTTLSNGNRNNQDIYDKLDSPSATDSNISFEINERKSQVIHITDVTNSLDDLERLDKLCRIIEISDELSDKLFSALDKNSDATEKKTWSFKDLCERIKLDDFCNKVFGKTAM